MISFEEAKEKNLTELFGQDGYDGINCYTIDYEQDAVFLRCDIWDCYEGLEEFFENEALFLSLRDVVDWIDENEKSCGDDE